VSIFVVSIFVVSITGAAESHLHFLGLEEPKTKI
jgi:hypothetical protein